MSTGNKRRTTPKGTGRLWFFHLAKKARRPSVARAAGTEAQAPMSFLIVSFLTVAVATLAFVYHLHVRFEGVWLGYETSRARAERARLIVERRELRLELASLKSPGEVESEAREKLGMEMPDHDRIVPIGKDLKPLFASGRAR
jgi:cell division protein FtsL